MKSWQSYSASRSELSIWLRFFLCALYRWFRGSIVPNRQGDLTVNPPPEGPEGFSVENLNPKHSAFIDRLIVLAASLDITIAIVPTLG